jgi:hypothetical protein
VPADENRVHVMRTESVTSSNAETNDVIGTIQSTIESSIPIEEERTALLEALRSLGDATDRSSFLTRATFFLGLAANFPKLSLHINTWSLVLGRLGEHFWNLT